METTVLKIGFILFWVACFAIRFPFSQGTKNNNIIKSQKSTKEKVLLGGTFLGMMVLPLIYVFTPWFVFANYDLPLVLNFIGLFLIVPCLWIFYRSHKDLGRNWSASLEVHEKHILIMNGVYKKIRHPMYTAIWVWGFIQFLLLQNYIAGLAGLLSFGLLYFLRIKEEESMMENQFGDAYLIYKKKTNRLIPKLF